MAEIFDDLGVYAWSRDDEAVMLSSILTGEPPLLVGNPGAAKTLLCRKIPRAIGVSAASFNADSASFEDILGFLNMKKLGEGEIEYVSTPRTIWDKKWVHLQEVNRPDEATHAKWLDYLADRTMMGERTQGIWVSSDMNPYGTGGTSELGEATIGRFASFLWIPDLVEMGSGERRSVIESVADSTLFGLGHWNSDLQAKHVDTTDYEGVGNTLKTIMSQAAQHFDHLMEERRDLTLFLDKFIISLAQASGRGDKGDTDEKPIDPIRIDGRRAGFLRRLIIGVRATELARASVLGIQAKPFIECARIAVRAGIPVGVNEEGGKNPRAHAKIRDVFEALSGALAGNTSAKELELQFELLTCRDIFRISEILLSNRDKLDDMVKSANWARITQSDGFNAALVGLVATNIEMKHPGAVPATALDGLTDLMKDCDILPRGIVIPPHLQPFEEEMMKIMDQPTIVGRLIATHKVSEFAAQEVEQEGERVFIARADDQVIAKAIEKLGREISQAVEQAGDFSAVAEAALA